MDTIGLAVLIEKLQLLSYTGTVDSKAGPLMMEMSDNLIHTTKSYRDLKQQHDMRNLEAKAYAIKVILLQDVFDVRHTHYMLPVFHSKCLAFGYSVTNCKDLLIFEASASIAAGMKPINKYWSCIYAMIVKILWSFILPNNQLSDVVTLQASQPWRLLIWQPQLTIVGMHPSFAIGISCDYECIRGGKT